MRAIIVVPSLYVALFVAMNTEENEEVQLPSRSLDVKARDLAKFIASNPGCSRADIVTNYPPAIDASSAAISRWLARAKELGMITSSGNTNAVRFSATAAVQSDWAAQELAKPLSHRQKVTYNFDFLDDYTPNKSSYLTQAQMSDLMRKCPPGSAPLSKFDPHDLSVFLCNLAHHSSALEGVKYKLADTVSLIEKAMERDQGTVTERTIILNHRDAVRYLIDHSHYPLPPSGHTGMVIDVRELDIRAIHAILAADLLRRPEMAGALRAEPIEINDSAYIPLSVPNQIAAAFRMICEKARQIRNPYEQSLFLSIHIPYLQPFIDCNKRTSRVTANIPLLRNGCAPMSWVDVQAAQYHDSLLSIYEFQTPSMLAEIYTESYLRGCERLAIMRRDKTPDQIAVTYRTQIRETVRNEVLSLTYTRPAEVDPDDHAAFDMLVAQQIEALLSNPVIGVRYKLSMLDIERFRENADIDRLYERVR